MRGRSPNESWADIAVSMGLSICPSKDLCPKGWGSVAHRNGRVDWHSTIHWDGLRRRSSVRGLRHFLKLVALAVHPHWMKEPKWRQLYLANTWAYITARDKFHIRLPSKGANSDREYIRWATRKIHLRTLDKPVYEWVYYPLRKR